MSYFTLAQQRKALALLVLFHLIIIASSNYLVQLPFTVFGLHTTWGAFTFPFIFLATDLMYAFLVQRWLVKSFS
ncbi:hypothetical protein [Vibrio anguillarum]|uniref:hypothetical protein n=1 Tax=Vibrio anguillarum TaxID=55601 RepID=UPI003CEF83D1